jgi:choline monooxygenase
MSNLATLSQLTTTSPQLPVAWYFDHKIHELEQKYLFSRAPNYVGHELMVPNHGDYYPLQLTDHSQMLMRNDNGVELIGNVCRHRQSIIFQEKGNGHNIVCPLHRWTYDLEGKLTGAPHFPRNPCKHLSKTGLQNWRGMLFDSKRDIANDLAHLSIGNEIDFTDFVLDKVEVREYGFNWKTFIEVYLEDYHVDSFHPGLGNFVNCADLKWEYGDWYSVQTVGVKNALAKAGTATYDKWHEAVRNLRNGVAPEYGAIWMVYYPNIMIEWYPHVLVINTLLPRGPEKCTSVVEFYYPEELALFERPFVEAQQKAYQETSLEDDEICYRMTDGRKALRSQGADDQGPYQSPMEDGMERFHTFMWEQIGPHL